MGMRIGGRNSNERKIVIKNLDGTVAATIGVSKPSKKKPKRLQYNFKEISAQVLRTKTSGNAGQVVVKARGKVAQLRKLLNTGEYDDKELRSAIIHAEQMLKVAKKKQKHLQEEEHAKKGGPCQADLEEYQEYDIQEILSEAALEISEEAMQEYMEEFQEQMLELMEEMAEEMIEESGLDELAEELAPTNRVSMDPADLEQLKKKHRQEELRDIIEADMKYLRAVFDKLAKDKQAAASGVSLELNGTEMPVQVSAEPSPVEGGTVDEVV